jgi:hypothetical protein
MKLSVTNTLCDGPTLRQNAVFHPHIFDVEVRQIVDEMNGPLGGVGIKAIAEPRRQPPCDNRGTGKAIVPGDRHAFIIETGRDPIKEHGPIHVVLDVLLGRPHNLDRTVDVLCDLDSAINTIGLEPAPEAAADQMIVHDDLLHRKARSLRGEGLGSCERLVANPDLATVVAHIDGAVHRFHRGMRKERNLVGRLDLG